MKNNFLSSRSFKVRAKVSIGIILIVLIGALTPDANGLRIVYAFAAVMSLLEVHTLAISKEQTSWGDLFHDLFLFFVLAFSILAVYIMPSALLIIGIILTMASDVGAYMVGKICGTKFIKSRPFPVISPNKSWEGVIGGLLAPGIAVPLLNWLFRDNLPGRPLSIMVGCLAGLCAIIGDTSESLFKRHHGAKDANDILKTKPGLKYIEAWLGGSEGHGGYFDRLDSMSMVLLLLGIVTVLSILLPHI